MYALNCAVATLAVALTLPAVALADGAMTMPDSNHVAGARMSVKAKVTKDPMKGYNLHLVTRAFRWAPQRAGKPFRNGEGHAHLFIDGTKVTRLYGPWFYLGSLAQGSHTVRVTLNGNDHGDYVNHHGEPIESIVRLTVQ